MCDNGRWLCSLDLRSFASSIGKRFKMEMLVKDDLLLTRSLRRTDPKIRGGAKVILAELISGYDRGGARRVFSREFISYG